MSRVQGNYLRQTHLDSVVGPDTDTGVGCAKVCIISEKLQIMPQNPHQRTDTNGTLVNVVCRHGDSVMWLEDSLSVLVVSPPLSVHLDTYL